MILGDSDPRILNFCNNKILIFPDVYYDLSFRLVVPDRVGDKVLEDLLQSVLFPLNKVIFTARPELQRDIIFLR